MLNIFNVKCIFSLLQLFIFSFPNVLNSLSLLKFIKHATSILVNQNLHL